jgi:CheY-like chemotaxis protein
MKSAILIDDDPITNFINTELLKKYASIESVTTHMTQEEVFSHLESLKPDNYPDLVLIDIRMPMVDGFMMAFEMISNFPLLTKHSQIYFLSSTLDPKDMEMARSLPFSKGFLRKPLSKELLETLFKNDTES